MTPSPDTAIDGIFRWPAAPEFNAPLHEQADIVWFDGVRDFPCLDLEKPSPYISTRTIFRHFLYAVGGIGFLFWFTENYSAPRTARVLATPPEFPYGNYLERGGEGSDWQSQQFSEHTCDEFKEWFLEQTRHPSNADFKSQPILAPYKMHDGVFTPIIGPPGASAGHH